MPSGLGRRDGCRSCAMAARGTSSAAAAVSAASLRQRMVMSSSFGRAGRARRHRLAPRPMRMGEDGMSAPAYRTAGCTRREFLAGVAAAAGVVAMRSPGTAGVQGRRNREVPWLDEVLTPPPDAPGGSLRPLLVDHEGRAIASLEGWQRRRAALERTWREFLGQLEVRRGRRPAVEVIEED